MLVTAGPDGFVATSNVADYSSHALLTEYLNERLASGGEALERALPRLRKAALEARARGADPGHSCPAALKGLPGGVKYQSQAGYQVAVQHAMCCFGTISANRSIRRVAGARQCGGTSAR